MSKANCTIQGCFEMKKIGLIAVAVVLLILTSACSPGREAFVPAANTVPVVIPDPSIVPDPALDVVYDVTWNDPAYPNFTAFTLKAGVSSQLNLKRVDIYSDVQCLELIDIVTPELLESSVVLWPMNEGINHVATIETDNDDVRSPCKVVASSSTRTDIVPPVAPENFVVNYRWLTATKIEISASWSASANDPSGTEYTLYLIDEPNGYAAPLAAEYTTELSHTFIYTVDDPSLFLGTSIFLHLVANDQSNNIAPLISDSGFYIGSIAPTLNLTVTYLYRGETGLEINLSGTCKAGQEVVFNYQNTVLMNQVLPVSTSCRYGTFSASFPSLYSWYQNNMIVTANQTDVNGLVTQFAKPFASEVQLDAVMLY